MPAYEEILKKADVADSAVAYIGDDLPDIPLMLRAGLAIAVGDAVLEVKNAAHYTPREHAGHGAIRETVELILKSKGIWEAMIDKARAYAVPSRFVFSGSPAASQSFATHHVISKVIAAEKPFGGHYLSERPPIGPSPLQSRSL